VVRQIGVVASQSLAIGNVFRFERLPIGGENEFRLLLCCRRTLSQRGESGRHLALWANLNVDVVALKHAARQFRLICVSNPEPLNRRLLVSESFQKREGEIAWVERLLYQPRNGFFNFDSVHLRFGKIAADLASITP